MAWLALRRKTAEAVAGSEPAGAAAKKSEDEELYGALAVEPLEVKIGQNLIPLFL
jgi:hypothetical protein